MISKTVLAYSGLLLSVATVFSIAYMNSLVTSATRLDIAAAAAGDELIRKARLAAADLLDSLVQSARTNAEGKNGSVSVTQGVVGGNSSTSGFDNRLFPYAANKSHLTALTASLSDDRFKMAMERSQRERQRRLMSACSAAALLPQRPRHEVIRPTFARTFNVPSLGITYCAIAKCATTTFRNFLATITGNPCYGRMSAAVVQSGKSPCSSRNVTRPRTFAEFEQNSVLIVRNPWSRLVSSYWNKFVVERHPLAEPCYARYGRTLFGGVPITFAQFVDCLLEDHRNGMTLNVHLAPMHWHCSPCQVRYTYIVNLETFTEDFKYLAKYVFPSNNTPEEYQLALKSTKLRPNEASNRTVISYRKCYESLSQAAINALQELYAADAGYYGYPPRPL